MLISLGLDHESCMNMVIIVETQGRDIDTDSTDDCFTWDDFNTFTLKVVLFVFNK